MNELMRRYGIEEKSTNAQNQSGANDSPADAGSEQEVKKPTEAVSREATATPEPTPTPEPTSIPTPEPVNYPELYADFLRELRASREVRFDLQLCYRSVIRILTGREAAIGRKRDLNVKGRYINGYTSD